MKNLAYNSLQLREIFHLEFLRLLGRKIKGEHYVLKGGVNLRFFFKSFRYSEDMDLDVYGITVEKLKQVVMNILDLASFRENLVPFGIKDIIAPDMDKAKQTETTQRFKTHLITTEGLDLFTKIEFSRRGYKGNVIIQSISNSILRIYKLLPLIVPHYDISSAIDQKINALALRAITQARDVFDLYILSSQYNPDEERKLEIKKNKLTTAVNNTYDISFVRFRDTVLAYLSIEDQTVYNSSAQWDEIRLKVIDFIEQFRK